MNINEEIINELKVTSMPRFRLSNALKRMHQEV
jgi:hypothetical protein